MKMKLSKDSRDRVLRQMTFDYSCNFSHAKKLFDELSLRDPEFPIYCQEIISRPEPATVEEAEATLLELHRHLVDCQLRAHRRRAKSGRLYVVVRSISNKIHIIFSRFKHHFTIFLNEEHLDDIERVEDVAHKVKEVMSWRRAV